MTCRVCKDNSVLLCYHAPGGTEGGIFRGAAGCCPCGRGHVFRRALCEPFLHPGVLFLCYQFIFLCQITRSPKRLGLSVSPQRCTAPPPPPALRAGLCPSSAGKMNFMTLPFSTNHSTDVRSLFTVYETLFSLFNCCVFCLSVRN